MIRGWGNLTISQFINKKEIEGVYLGLSPQLALDWDVDLVVVCWVENVVRGVVLLQIAPYSKDLNLIGCHLRDNTNDIKGKIAKYLFELGQWKIRD